jgi:phosphatidylethanolamine/phosphatidyl-N-methylethanolamine N-methyltransferase
MGDSRSDGVKSSSRATALVKKRYDQMASLFDFLEDLAGGAPLRRWRALSWTRVEGSRILEVGVGTGPSFAFYPRGATVTAIDLSPKMLGRARRKIGQQNVTIILEEMDVQSLRFADGAFDTVIASLVFCAVPDPVRGLNEIRRVCRPGGKVVLLEHVLSSGRLLGFMMNLLNPLVFWMIGDNFNRKTVENVAKSGLVLEKVTSLSGIFKLIEARKERTGLEPIA